MYSTVPDHSFQQWTNSFCFQLKHTSAFPLITPKHLADNRYCGYTYVHCCQIRVYTRAHAWFCCSLCLIRTPKTHHTDITSPTDKNSNICRKHLNHHIRKKHQPVDGVGCPSALVSRVVSPKIASTSLTKTFPQSYSMVYWMRLANMCPNAIHQNLHI